jgi:excinuclease ABC subunit A
MIPFTLELLPHFFVIVYLAIEHNLEVIKCADWIIDLGPEAGEKNGGHIVFAGTPEDMVKNGKGYTAEFLKKKLK